MFSDLPSEIPKKQNTQVGWMSGVGKTESRDSSRKMIDIVPNEPLKAQTLV